MKKSIVALVSALLIGSVIACGKKEEGKVEGAKTDEITKIKYVSYTAGADHKEALDEVVRLFEAENPNVKVEYETIGYNDYFTKLKTQAASNTLPDVFEINFENFISFADMGVLYDFTELAKTNGFDESKMVGNTINNFKYDGKLHGLTAQASTVLTFYNKDLFDKAGIEYPNANWTWQDEIDAAKKLTNSKVYGSYFPMTYNELFKLVAQNGGSLFDAAGKPTINSPENVETVQYMADRILKHKIQPTPEYMSGKSPEDMFKNGEIAILHTGIWMFENFKSANFKWDVAIEAKNKKTATHVFADGIVAPAKSKNPEIAWKFIEFMSTSEKVAKIRLEKNMGLPVLNNSEIQSQYVALGAPDNRQAVLDSLGSGAVPPATTSYARLSDIINKELGNILLGTKDVKTALDDAQKEAEGRIFVKVK